MEKAEKIVKEFTYKDHVIRITDQGGEGDLNFCYRIVGMERFIGYEDAEDAEENAKAHVEALIEFGLEIWREEKQ